MDAKVGKKLGLKERYALMTRDLGWETTYQPMDKVYPYDKYEGIKIQATKISSYFRIKGVPENYFIDRDGVLQYVQVGPFTSLGQFQSIIDPMLNQ